MAGGRESSLSRSGLARLRSVSVSKIQLPQHSSFITPKLLVFDRRVTRVQHPVEPTQIIAQLGASDQATLLTFETDFVL